MSEPTPAPVRVGAWQAIGDSLSAGWERMVYLLFKGPGANPGAWALWGLILLIAGATGGGGGSGSNWDVPDDKHSLPDPSDIEPWMIAVGVAVFLVLVVLIVVWMYFQARFRFVLLEGVRVGVPRIRGVFGTTGQVGWHYFLFNLAMSFIALLLVAPLLIAWVPAALGILRGETDPFRDALPLFLISLLWFLMVAFAAAIVQWWLYDLVLPYAWLGKIGFRPGLGRAWRLTRDRPEAVLALLVTRIAVGIGGAIAGCIVACVSCVLWIWPVLGIVAAAMVSVAYPLLWIVTGPLILLLGLATAWIMATVMAPIPLFYRAWSWAFVNRLDPSVPLWSTPAEISAPVLPPTLDPPDTSDGNESP